MNKRGFIPMLCILSSVAILLRSPFLHTNAQQSATPGYQFPAPQELNLPQVGEVTLTDLPVITPQPKGVRFMPPMRMNISEERYRFLQEHAANPSSVSPGELPLPAPALPFEEIETPVAVKAFPGVNETNCGGFIPSDGGFAVSPTQLVQVANSCIEVVNASTGAVQSGPTSLNTFFAFPAGHTVGDPRALYDWNQGRFIAIAEDFSTCPTTLGIAVSKTSNATGAYFIFHIGMGGLGDFPMMGQSLQEFGDVKGAIYLSWNVFNCVTGASSNMINFFGKSKLYIGVLSGRSVSNITFNGVPLDSIQPVSVTGRSDRPRTEYLVSAANNSNPLPMFCSGGMCNGYSVLSISHGIGAGGPVLSGYAASNFNGTHTDKALFNYTVPKNAHQAGGGGCPANINTGDNRISGEVYYQGGSLYLAHSVGTAVGSATHISKFHPFLSTSNNAAVITGGEVENDLCFACGGQGVNGSNYYASIIPDPDGNLTMVYEFSDDVTHPEVAYLSNRTSFPLGNVSDVGLALHGGSATYCQLDQSGRNRWGDYTGNSPSVVTNPTSPEAWFWGQYSDPSGNWATSKGLNGYSSVDQVGH